MELMVAVAVAGLACVFGIVNLACAVVFLIQLFKQKGPAHGILGICCGLYAFIWALQNQAQLDASNPPPLGLRYQYWSWIWAVVLVVNIVLQVISTLLQMNS
jgi:hypothetical protein